MMLWRKKQTIEVAQSLMEDSHAIAAMRAQAFDLVLRDFTFWPTHLPAEMLQIPEIDLIAVSTLMPICANRWSIPNPISYIPQFTSSRLPNAVRLRILCTRFPAAMCWYPMLKPSFYSFT